MKVQDPPIAGAQYFGAAEWERLLKFADLLSVEGERRGLVGPREMDKLWDRHILNSAVVSEFLPPKTSLFDVGSGAGFPGLVTAIIRSDLQVTLIEPMERRCEWLNYAINNLELKNVEVVRARAEDLIGKRSAEFVTARAVAALKKLIPCALPLVKSGGSLLALKGERAELEIDAAAKELKKYRAKWVDVHNVTVWGVKENTRIVEVRAF